MLTGGDHLTMQHVRASDRLLLGHLFIYQSQRFRAVARVTVSRDSFVESKYPFGFGGSLLGVNESFFVIARLDVVINEFFRRILRRAARVTLPFEAFSGETVIATAAYRV